MKRIANWRFVACFTVLAFACIALEDFVSNNLLADICGNTVIGEVLSPEQGQKAVISQRNCGATTGYSTEVSVLPAQKLLPNEGGNIFVVDEDDGDVSVSWINPTQLKIIYDHRARIFSKRNIILCPSLMRHVKLPIMAESSKSKCATIASLKELKKKAS